MESEGSKNNNIKRYPLADKSTSNYNSNTCENCKKWEKQCNENFSQLNESVNQVNGTIEEMKATNARENIAIMEALAIQKVLTEKLLGREKSQMDMRKTFPLQTADDLTATNNKISESNRAEYTRCMSSLLKGQLRKTLTEIFSEELIIASNVDGLQGKVPLKKFKRFFDTFMDAIRQNGEEDPEKSVRLALKVIKKRHFQSICVQKKKDAALSSN